MIGSSQANASRLLSAMNTALSGGTQGNDIPNDAQFGFNCLLQTPEVMLKNDEFDMEFEIPFDEDMTANEAEIIVYNLTDSTANKFKVGNSVMITAGYGKDTGMLFQGFISKVSTVRDGVDKITTIYALDDIKYTPQMMDEKTYSEGTKASTILKDLLDRLGLPIEVFKPQRDHIYDGETKIDGSIVENIKEYSDVCGVSTYIYKQRIYCRPIWDGDNLHFNVNSSTGMIDSPEPFEEENQNEEYIDSVKGYNINMILQHRISTAGIVHVDSVNYKGDYRIVSGTHSYDGLSATTEFKCIHTIDTRIDYSALENGSDKAVLKDDVVWTKKEIPNVKTYIKTYMDYKLYTDKTASGYKYLHGSENSTNSAGFRMYGECLCCAYGSYYGKDGTFVKVEWTNPSDNSKVTIYTVKGDQKRDSETDSRHMYHPYEGGSGSVCEFIVDGDIITSQSKMYDTAKAYLGLEQQAYITGIWTTDTYPFTSGSSSSMASKVIKTAKAELGTRESGNNNQKYGSELGCNGMAWCGIFVAWCLKKSGFGLPSFNYKSATAYAYAAHKNGWGKYHAKGSGYKPKKGDIFIANYTGSDFAENGHVGLVEKSSGDSKFITIEGNCGDKVASRELNISGYTFVTPPYKG